MNHLCNRTARILGAIVFAALLLVPLLESGHNHAARDLAKPCAVCVVTHHTPVSAAPVVLIAAPSPVTAVANIPTLVAPVRVAHSPQSGRAPPAPTHIASV